MDTLTPPEYRLYRYMHICCTILWSKQIGFQIHMYENDIFLSHFTLQWRYNDPDGVSNHRRLECILNRLFRRRSKKTSKLPVTRFCGENSPVTGEFLAQGPVMRKIFPLDNVIMSSPICSTLLVFFLQFSECFANMRFWSPSGPKEIW